MARLGLPLPRAGGGRGEGGRRPRRLAATAAVLLAAVTLATAARAQPAGLTHHVAIEDPTGHALDHLHAALARAETARSRVRISVWGASHTASDKFTGFLRELWRPRYGDGGPGFVLPAEPFPLYANREARVAPPGAWRTLRVRGRRRTPGAYGPAGFALEATRADGWIELARPVDTVHLHYLRQPNGGRLSVRAGEARRVVSTDGDGPAVLTLTPAGGARRVEVGALGPGPVRVFGASLERGDGGLIVDAMGVPGARLRDRQPWDDAAFRAGLARLAPDLIVLAYGTNESGFTGRPLRRYRAEAFDVVRRARAAAPEASCLLIGPSDWPERATDGTWRARERTAAVIEIQRAAAARFGCGFFDLVAFQGGPASMPRWVAAGLALDDHVHFTDDGHRLLARALGRALLPR